MELPIPLPSEIPISEFELLTPFPFMYEAPLINPCLNYGKIISDLFSNFTKLTNDESGILLEVIAAYPSLIE